MFTTIPLITLFTAVLTWAPVAIVCTIAYFSLQKSQHIYPRATKWAKLGFFLGGAQIFVHLLFRALEFSFVHRLHGSGIPLRSIYLYAFNLSQSLFWAGLNTFIFYCLYRSIRALIEPRDA